MEFKKYFKKNIVIIFILLASVILNLFSLNYFMKINQRKTVWITNLSRSENYTSDEVLEQYIKICKDNNIKYKVDKVDVTLDDNTKKESSVLFVPLKDYYKTLYYYTEFLKNIKK